MDNFKIPSPFKSWFAFYRHLLEQDNMQNRQNFDINAKYERVK